MAGARQWAKGNGRQCWILDGKGTNRLGRLHRTKWSCNARSRLASFSRRAICASTDLSCCSSRARRRRLEESGDRFLAGIRHPKVCGDTSFLRMRSKRLLAHQWMLLCPRDLFVLCSSEAYAAERLGLLGTRHSGNFSLTYVDLSQRCRRSRRNSGAGGVTTCACSYRDSRNHRLHK